MRAGTAELQLHEETSSILFQQWNQSREDKWGRKCHGRVSHWSSREANLSSFLSAGIRIIQWGSPAADCLLLCLVSLNLLPSDLLTPLMKSMVCLKLSRVLDCLTVNLFKRVHIKSILICNYVSTNIITHDWSQSWESTAFMSWNYWWCIEPRCPLDYDQT